VLSFIQVEFPANERPRAFAVYGMTFALGGVSGPLIGGLLTQTDLFGLAWRPIFLVNLPIGILALHRRRGGMGDSRGAHDGLIDTWQPGLSNPRRKRSPR
jgi:MFS family permease